MEIAQVYIEEDNLDSKIMDTLEVKKIILLASLQAIGREWLFYLGGEREELVFFTPMRHSHGNSFLTALTWIQL